jgi:hypothetical protein
MDPSPGTGRNESDPLQSPCGRTIQVRDRAIARERPPQTLASWLLTPSDDNALS